MTAGGLTPRGRSLRQRGGMAEARIWARLRGGAIDGWKVRRHGRDDVVLRDHLRQQAIEALGWTVVRFTNDQALAEPWRIDAAIREQAKALGL